MTRGTPSLHTPFKDLTGFPTKPVAAGSSVWRVVRKDHVVSPVWFGCSGDGRFDLHHQDSHGVTYVGFSPAASILESTFRDIPAGIPMTVAPAMFSERRLCRLSLPASRNLANMRDPGVVGYGVTAEINSITPYKRPQWWSQALHDTDPERIDGVFFEPRHLPTGEAAALYGPLETAEDWRSALPITLTAARLRRHLNGTGVSVLEPPSFSGLTVVP